MEEVRDGRGRLAGEWLWEDGKQRASLAAPGRCCHRAAVSGTFQGEGDAGEASERKKQWSI